jgi:hypothetical protein
VWKCCHCKTLQKLAIIRNGAGVVR